MRYGESLFFERERSVAKETDLKIQGYSPISWDEVLSSGFNYLWNHDTTGTSFEGEIGSIDREGDKIIIRCKWIKALEPFFDEDGDIDHDRAEWRTWHNRSTHFSINTVPRKVPNTSQVIIPCLFESDYSTTTTLAKV